MSRTDSLNPPPSDPPELPEFDLEFLVDDPVDPATVTIYTANETVDITTHWITIDADHAIALDGIA